MPAFQFLHALQCTSNRALTMFSGNKIIIIKKKIKWNSKYNMSAQDKLFIYIEHRRIFCFYSISKCFESRTQWEILMVLKQCQNGKEVLQA